MFIIYGLELYFIQHHQHLIFTYIYNICSIFTSPAVTLSLVRNESETELQDEVATSMLQTNLEVAKPQQIATWQIMARHVVPVVFFGLPTKTHTHKMVAAFSVGSATCLRKNVYIKLCIWAV